jgi:hypothetical protein
MEASLVPAAAPPPLAAMSGMAQATPGFAVLLAAAMSEDAMADVAMDEIETAAAEPDANPAPGMMVPDLLVPSLPPVIPPEPALPAVLDAATAPASVPIAQPDAALLVATPPGPVDVLPATSVQPPSSP